MLATRMLLLATKATYCPSAGQPVQPGQDRIGRCYNQPCCRIPINVTSSSHNTSCTRTTHTHQRHTCDDGILTTNSRLGPGHVHTQSVRLYCTICMPLSARLPILTDRHEQPRLGMKCSYGQVHSMQEKEHQYHVLDGTPQSMAHIKHHWTSTSRPGQILSITACCFFSFLVTNARQGLSLSTLHFASPSRYDYHAQRRTP